MGLWQHRQQQRQQRDKTKMKCITLIVGNRERC
jgi:hypothetical protein